MLKMIHMFLMQVEVKVFGAGKISLKQVPFDDCT